LAGKSSSPGWSCPSACLNHWGPLFNKEEHGSRPNCYLPYCLGGYLLANDLCPQKMKRKTTAAVLRLRAHLVIFTGYCGTFAYTYLGMELRLSFGLTTEIYFYTSMTLFGCIKTEFHMFLSLITSNCLCSNSVSGWSPLG
jgi:hypothetical protein